MKYRIDELGWFLFERLSQVVATSMFGDTVEHRGGSRDSGLDAFSVEDVASSRGGVKLPGPVAFQAKFIEGANAPRAKYFSDLQYKVREELSTRKLRSRPELSSAKSYVLVTNAPLKPAERTKLEAMIQEVPHIQHCHLISSRDLESFLTTEPAIRQSFPILLGIADLEYLIAAASNRDVSNRSSAAMALAKSFRTQFVDTGHYHNALRMLNERNFVVLYGPPEAGKTTIARMIGLAKASLGWMYVEAFAPNDIEKSYDPVERQIFVADDAFGTTQYDPGMTVQWEKSLPLLLSWCDDTHWIIFTSRKIPLEQALQKMHLQGHSIRFEYTSHLLIDVSRIQHIEKAQMLYRHAKSIDLLDWQKGIIQQNCRAITYNPLITPLRIHHLVETIKNLIDQPKEVQLFVADTIKNYNKVLMQSFVATSSDIKNLLFCALDSTAIERSYNTLKRKYEHKYGLPTDEFAKMVRGIDSQFLTFNETDKTYTYTHPSVEDMLMQYLLEHDVDRIEFTRTAGVRGIKLLIGQTDSKHPARQTLITSTRDILLLLNRLIELFAGLSNSEMADVLSSLLHMKDRLFSVTQLDVNNSIEEKIRELLVVARGRAMENKDVSILFFEQYYQCSLLFRDTLVQMPDFQAIYAFYEKKALTELNTLFEQSEDVKTYELFYFPSVLEEFVELRRLIRKSEPRFLVGKELSEGWLRNLRKFSVTSFSLDEDDCKEMDSDSIRGASKSVESWVKFLTHLLENGRIEVDIRSLDDVVYELDDVAREVQEEEYRQASTSAYDYEEHMPGGGLEEMFEDL